MIQNCKIPFRLEDKFFFQGKFSLESIFCWENILILRPEYFELNPKCLRTKILLEQHFFGPKNLFDPNSCHTATYFNLEYLSTQTFFLGNFFSDPTSL